MISAGRVGVRPDQVDGYGRIKITNEMVIAIKEKLDLLEAGRLMALEVNKDESVKEVKETETVEETKEVKEEAKEEAKEVKEEPVEEKAEALDKPEEEEEWQSGQEE